MRERKQPDHEKDPDRPARRATGPSPEWTIPPSPGGLSPERMLGLQRSIGNAAVAQLRAYPERPHRPDETDSQAPQSKVPDVLRSSGRSLDESTRQDMEARFGADFSQVRLHTDSTAQRSAAELGARAYTSGHHIVAGAGGIDKHTLAHELTHVLQQRQGPVDGTDNGNGLRVSDPGDRFEQDAEANARRVMNTAAPAQRSADPGYAATTPRPAQAAVQRMAGTDGEQLKEVVAAEVIGTFDNTGAEDTPSDAGIVAMVPCTVDGPEIANIAARYRDQGFAPEANVRRHLALVVGVNAWGGDQGAEQQVKDKIKLFRRQWKGDQFPVGVVGFTWTSHKVTSAEGINQATIPYGEIRQHILTRHIVPELIGQLTSMGRQHVYLHTGDSDTVSLDTQDGPLFTAAAKTLDEGQVDLLSGGYTTPSATPNTATLEELLVWHATQLDLAVREAMASEEPSSVYFPEPNTFIKVKTELDFETLDPGIDFGKGDQEGQQLVKSLYEQRKMYGVKQKFDRNLAITTNTDRIGAPVTKDLKENEDLSKMLARLYKYIQSHARKEEWADRVENAFGLEAGIKSKLASQVYDSVIDLDRLSKAAKMPSRPSLFFGRTFTDSLSEKVDWKNTSDATRKQVITLAKKTKNALFDKLLDAYQAILAFRQRPRRGG